MLGRFAARIVPLNGFGNSKWPPEPVKADRCEWLMAMECGIMLSRSDQSIALLWPSVAFASVAPSCRGGRRPRPGNQSQDFSEHLSRCRNLSQEIFIYDGSAL